MLNPVRLPRRVRSIISKSFHHFGIHCASHPKRVILISCVVITSLFYPALALYSSSNSLSPLTSLYAFFDAYQSDLREIWEGHDALHVLDDAATRARCGRDRTLRIERVLITSSESTSTGAATPLTLRLSSKLRNKIGRAITRAEPLLSCVRTPNNECFVLSPDLLFERGIPSTPAEVLDRINKSPNISVSGIHVGVPMVFSSRSSPEDLLEKEIEHVGFLALTYFFLENDCLASEGHEKWQRTLENTVSDLGSTSVAPFVFQKPRFLALQYDPTLSRPSHFSAISLFLYLSYLGVFLSFSGSLRRMDTVHSRFGLTFTGLIEIVASTIASVSVCALAGFRVTMVPWGILPVIIVFVGAENMFLLVDAVTSTSVTLSVKQRVGTGLATAATSNTLKTVTYNSILGIIAFFATGAIRQFCSFAIVLLVAHWFLIHTFFVAVLSIDLQRLELSDMLTQDKASKPTVPLVASKPTNEASPSKRRLAMNRIQKRLRVMPTKNGSLLLMLAVTVTLYYVTYPFPSRPKDQVDPISFLQQAMRRPVPLAEEPLSPARIIWNTLNPEHDALVHIRIETPMVVALNTQDTNEPQRDGHRQDRRSYEPMARSALWLLKIVILPIGTTTACLYVLLLYLLKDADLLEAQRHRPDVGSPDASNSSACPVEGTITFTTLPRAFATDVEFVATNDDASTVAVVSRENELVLWNGRYHEIGVSGVLLAGPSSSSAQSCITAVALDSSGRYCAIGTGTGVVAVWRVPSLEDPAVSLLLTFVLPASVADLAIVPIGRSRSVDASTDAVSDLCTSVTSDLSILVGCNHGCAFQARLCCNPAIHSIPPSRANTRLRSHFLRTLNHDGLYLAYAYDDGAVELFSRSVDGFGWDSMCIQQAGNPLDPVTELCLGHIDVDGSSVPVVGAATRAGVISLWDPIKEECIFLMDSSFGDVTHLRIAPMLSQPCPRCGQLTPDAFTLSFSVGHMVFVYRASVSSVAKRCACPVTRKLFPRGRRSRSGSMAHSSSSPSKTRPRLPSASTPASITDTPPFPVSGHGVHSRRAGSEKEASRRVSESLPVIGSQPEDYDFPLLLRPSSSKLLTNGLIPCTDSVWRNLVMDHIVDIGCERGGWDLIDGQQLVGLRRRSRLVQNGRYESDTPLSTKSAPIGRAELTPSVLTRWELWTFDPTKPDGGVKTSSLLTLTLPSNSTTKGSLYPRLPFTRVDPVVIRTYACVAGLGNTTGIIKLSQRPGT